MESMGALQARGQGSTPCACTIHLRHRTVSLVEERLHDMEITEVQFLYRPPSQRHTPEWCNCSIEACEASGEGTKPLLGNHS